MYTCVYIAQGGNSGFRDSEGLQGTPLSSGVLELMLLHRVAQKSRYREQN